MPIPQSLKKRLEELEKRAAYVEEIGLEGFVRLSYLPKPLPDDLVRLMEASKFAPLIREAFGSWARNGGGNTPPAPAPAPAASYRGAPVVDHHVDYSVDHRVDYAPVVPVKEPPKPIFEEPRQRELPVIIPQPGESLEAAMFRARESEPRPSRPAPKFDGDLAKEAREKWLAEQFGDAPNRPFRRHPGL